MNVMVEQVREHLQKQLMPLDTQASELESTLAGINEDRKRLRAALRALDGDAAKNRSKPGRKCATKDMVIELATGLVRDNGSVPKTDMKQILKMKIQDKGLSLSGFTLRFNEALSSGQFQTSDDGVVSLRSTPKMSGMQAFSDALQS